MNGVLGLAKVLLGTDLAKDQREYVESIHGSGSALLGILNDILDLSKAESGKLELESIPMDLTQCAKDVIELLRVDATAKGNIELGLAVGKGVPQHVLGDPGRLRQILLNPGGQRRQVHPQGAGRRRARSDRRRPRAFAAHDRGPRHRDRHPNRNSRSACSKRSHRPTRRRRGGSAAPDWASRSASTWPFE